MKKIGLFLIFVLLFFLLSDGAFAVTEPISIDSDDEHMALFKPVSIDNGSKLNIVECVALAFKNSPKIKRQKYNLDIAKSNVGIAKSAFFPVIGAGVGFSNINNSNNNFFPNHTRELPNVAVSVNQLVWDFGKSTSNIKMEEFYKIGAEYEFMDSLCMTLFDIKKKYYAVLKAKAILCICEDDDKICEKYVEIAKNEPDLITAKLNLSKSRVELARAKNDYKNSLVNLANSMYLDTNIDFDILNTQTFSFNRDYSYDNENKVEAFIPFDFSFDKSKVMEIAYQNSPDLRVLESTKEAMIQSLKYIRRKYFPELRAGVGYGFNNVSEPNVNFSNNSLQVGVNLTSDVNIMELKHSIKGADAQVALADNEIELFKKDLRFEVQRAFNNVESSKNEVAVSQTGAEQSLQNIRTVENAYKNGILDYVALQDARKDYIDAVNKYVESLYNYNIALIQVEEAMHFHIVDIHHKTQHAIINHSDELIEHLNDALNCNEQESKKSTKKKNKKTNL